MDFLELAKKRQSIRAFTAENVTDEQLNLLLEAAIAAPSAGNRQAWHFVVLRNQELKTAVAVEAANQPWIATAPVVFVVCADPTLNADRYAERGRELYMIQDTAAAIENILLCATSIGLGGCWCGGFDEAEAASILELSPNLRPVAIVAVGHPDEEPKRRPRRPLEEAVTIRD